MNTEKQDSVYSYEEKILENQEKIKTNNFIFGILMILTQIAVGIIYGLLANIPAVNVSSTNQYVGSILPIFLNFGMLFVVVLGFGLVFAYIRRLVWSSIGFNLLITCLTIQLFFLMNAFWTKVDIGGTGSWTQVFLNKTFNIYLANTGAGATVGSEITSGSTLTQAIHCALANIIAFSAVLGKAGPLEAWILCVFGTFGYELNRKVILLLGFDYGGSFVVFTYGGFLGLFMSIMLNCVYKGDQKGTQKNRNYTGNSFSVALSLMGNLIVWALFPILTMDPEVDSRTTGSTFQLYTVPLNIFFGMAASTVMSLGLSSAINHSIAVRDVVQAPIAGAVAIASSAYYITNPVYALVIGSVAGIIQTLLQNLVEKPASRKGSIINTFSFVAFGVQGILSSIFASGFRQSLNNQTNQLTITLTNLPLPVFSFVIACISAGIAIIFGILIGIFLMISAKHVRDQHFHDFTYWINDDGISYDLPNEEESIDSSDNMGDIYIKETVANIKTKHAYL